MRHDRPSRPRGIIERRANPFRFFTALKDRLLAWFADAQNGIQDFYSRVFKGERAELEELCLGSTCVNEQQLQSLLGAAAAGAGPATAPSGSSTPVATRDADTATTTTPASEDEEAADVPSVGDETPANTPAPTEADDMGKSATEAATAGSAPQSNPAPPQAANDNDPAGELPASGTDG